nr:alpha/beta hydrolase [Arenibaculum pallidiluteum]
MGSEAPGSGKAAEFTLKRGDATIAFRRTPGRGPGLVFLGGYRSDMTGTKALALEAHCRARGRAFLRFDYQGHGASGGRFEDGTIGSWTEDALAALDAETEGPQILVGSSMGGWIMLLAALARPERVAGLVGIAAAPDFTEDLIWDLLPPDQRARMLAEGRIEEPSQYGEPLVYTRALVEDGRRRLLLRAQIPFAGPVRLLHGQRDPDVPWQTALRLAERLDGEDVTTVLVKDGDHRLSRPQDLDLLCHTVDEVLGRVGAG